MLALTIEDTKKFMSSLLIENLFDDYVLVHAQIKTSVTFEIDGRCNRAFFDTEELQAKNCEFEKWANIKPVVMNMIKGRRLPVRMHISLKASGDDNISYGINILYENASLKLVTNTMSSGFTLNRPDGSEWDRTVCGLLSDNAIPYVEMIN